MLIRRLGLALLCAYTVTLAVASIRNVTLPPAAANVSRAAASILDAVGIEAGRTVFGGDPESSWVPRTICVRVIGEREGERRLIRDCPTQLYQKTIDPLSQTFRRIGRGVWDSWVDGQPQPQSTFDLAAWGCWSQATGGDSERVAVLVDFDALEFTTGERRQVPLVPLWFDCGSARAVPGEWPDHASLLGSVTP